ncbi:MAG: acyl-CoA dehydrogenase family protein [Pseudomonadota bacterium]
MADVLSRARGFASGIMRENAQGWEATRRYPRDAFSAAAQAGLGGLLVPAEQGGSGLTISGMADVMATLSAADLGFAFSLVCHNNLAGGIAANGSEAQRAAFIGPMIRGEALGAFLLTEPEAGSDAAALRTLARPDGDGWVLNGTKAWITNGTDADVLSVYAQTEEGAGARGIAAFLVRADQPGVVRGAPYHMLSGHAMGVSDIRFDNVTLSAEQLFYPPGEAFKKALFAIDIARIVLSRMCAAMLADGLAAAVDYTAKRTAFGAPLSEKQGLRWMLADVATDLAAANALIDKALATFEAGDAQMPDLAAHAKKFTTRVVLKGLGACMQAMGANGFRQDFPVARHFAAAKMTQYMDGATEIQNEVIARRLFAGR